MINQVRAKELDARSDLFSFGAVLHQWTQERANPVISGVPEPLPTHRLKRVQSAASFYAAFRPLFRRFAR
jgi:hypothetical protein